MLWDTAGQEEFDAITKAYYRGDYIIFMLYILKVQWDYDYDCAYSKELKEF